MPFIGTTPTQGFVSSVNKESFTANSILTSFTLSYPVANANDLEVFVGNVRQEPTAAYSASGTTLTMTEAPASGLNFYVIYKNQAQVTTTPPDGSVSSAKMASGAAVGNIGTGAIATAKLADDAVTLAKANDNFYKTGTFSVLFRDGYGGGGNDSQTFTNPRYTKIGDLVSIYVHCQNITTSGMGASQTMYFHGLPFKPRLITPVACVTSNVNMADPEVPVFFIASENVNSGYFQRMQDNAVPVNLTVSDFDNGQADIIFQLTYHTDE